MSMENRRSYHVNRDRMRWGSSGSSDLWDEVVKLVRSGDIGLVGVEVGSFRITEGNRYFPTINDYIWIPGLRLLGVAWGSKTRWLTVDDIDSGMQQWVNELEESAGENA